MGTLNLKHIFGEIRMDGDPVVIALFEAMIAEIGRLEQRIEVLERVREFGGGADPERGEK